MKEAAMSEKSSVGNAKPKRQNIHIGKYRTYHGQKGEPFGCVSVCKAFAGNYADNSVGYECGHESSYVKVFSIS